MQNIGMLLQDNGIEKMNLYIYNKNVPDVTYQIILVGQQKEKMQLQRK